MQAHQQKRTTLYGFLTNYDQVMFLKTTAEKGRVVEILRTRPMPFISDDSSNVSEGVKLLVGLLNMNVCELDPKNTVMEPNETLCLYKYLREGGTSMVFDIGNNRVVKVCRHSVFVDTFDREVQIRWIPFSEQL